MGVGVWEGVCGRGCVGVCGKHNNGDGTGGNFFEVFNQAPNSHTTQVSIHSSVYVSVSCVLNCFALSNYRAQPPPRSPRCSCGGVIGWRCSSTPPSLRILSPPGSAPSTGLPTLRTQAAAPVLFVVPGLCPSGHTSPRCLCLSPSPTPAGRSGLCPRTQGGATAAGLRLPLIFFNNST